jgi:probable rRNA maturation factor
LIHISITNRQKTLAIDRPRIRRAVTAIVRDAGIKTARIGVAVLDDAAIAELHDRFLGDPRPTDVLSFTLERSAKCLEGEIAVSAETAAANAARYRQTAEEELLLYVIHGTLHLVGHDDATPRQRAAMRKREKEYLRRSFVV